MASAAKATRGYVSARIYLSETDWDYLRHEGVDENVSASAIVTALVRRYRTDAKLRAQALEDARDVSADRRKRTD